MKKMTFFLTFLTLAAPALCDTKVKKEHPRILFNAESAKQIEKRVAGEYKQEFKQITDYLDKHILPYKYDGHSWGWAYNLRTLAFGYRFSKNPKYLEKINIIFEKLNESIPKEEFTTALFTRSAAMAYDWCYDDMTPAQRKVAVSALMKMAKYSRSLWRHNDFNNHVIINWMAPLWAALAVSGDGDKDVEAFSSQIINQLEPILKKNFMAAMDMTASDDGGNPEGYYYANWGTTPALAHIIELWRVATGENLWEKSPYMRYFPIWDMYGMRPFDGALERSEDSLEGYKFKDGNEGRFMPLLAARNKDPYAAWIATQIKKTPHPTRQFYDIIWQDRSVKPKGPEAFPLGRHFDGLGWVFTRSGWKNDDSFALFQCGDYFAGHQHQDNNAFVIHRYAPLAVDTGHYENGAHRGNYLARSIAHNTVTIFDPNEQFGGGTWGSGKPGSGANDGGQLHMYHPSRIGDVKKGGKFDRGNIIAYETTPAFTYAVGDATRSYSPHKLKEFTRTFLHVRPGVFVVFDRVEATSPDFKKRWLLHSSVKPSLRKNTVVIENGDGRLYSQAMFPKDIDVTVVGGEGHAYEVNGKDYPPKKGYEKNPPWRIEESPKSNAARQYFLHILQTPKKDESPYEAELIEKDGMLGVAWREGDTRHEVVFRKEGTSGGNYTKRKGDNAILKHKFTENVIPETSEQLLKQK